MNFTRKLVWCLNKISQTIRKWSHWKKTVLISLKGIECRVQNDIQNKNPRYRFFSIVAPNVILVGSITHVIAIMILSESTWINENFKPHLIKIQTIFLEQKLPYKSYYPELKGGSITKILSVMPRWWYMCFSSSDCKRESKIGHFSIFSCGSISSTDHPIIMISINASNTFHTKIQFLRFFFKFSKTAKIQVQDLLEFRYSLILLSVYLGHFVN